MDVSTLATSFGARLPAWVLAELADVPAAAPSDAERLALTNRLAARNHREDTGGPFAALVVERDSGLIISAGVNVVLASGLSSVHAEVTALSLAQTRLGRWDLGAPGTPDLELVVNWRPCVMCYGAAMWSGVRRLLIAGDGPELEELTGFDEGPMREDWAAQFAARGIEVAFGDAREEAIAVFAEYGARDDAVVYNARGTATV
ncbi:nucleoside deaminase [Actinocorallia sp. API 0066]|uniref:nucleoside deaminase n=1 Tax=Actinocorallia sp. API 0066 TaxID=2896846 RepID=UPI001E4EFE92|nr:nucleoside deaminase [Actinocorallia sp. API 0066]MCD0449738.1 nucleoside deaminase [Actinocorallia sp. API 0066]